MNVWILGKLEHGKLGTGFGLVRIWGSMGWIIATVTVGALVESTDIRYAFVIGAALIAIVMILPIRDDEEVEKPEPVGEPVSRNQTLRRVLPFGVATIIRAFSVGMTYTFLSVYLDRIGTPFWLIGWGWAISALPEIPLMVLAGKLSDRIGRIPLLIAGFACSSTMAFVFAFIDEPVLAVAFMSLSGVSYALTYISSIGFLADVAPRDKQATAQGVFSIITTQMPRVAGPFAGGLIIDTYGLRTMFLLAGTLTLGAVILLLVSSRLGGQLRGR
jgi:PPP family 3-phenylpropionic acid transporter